MTEAISRYRVVLSDCRVVARSLENIEMRLNTTSIQRYRGETSSSLRRMSRTDLLIDMGFAGFRPVVCIPCPENGLTATIS